MNNNITPLLNQIVQVSTESWRTMGSEGGRYGFVATGRLLLDFPIEWEKVYRLTGVDFALSFRESAVHHIETQSNPPVIVLKSTP